MQQLLESFYMAVILMNRVTQLVFLAVYILSPVVTRFRTIYPSLICLGLNNEYTINRYNYMVNLRCESVVVNQKVIDDFVAILG